MVGFEGDAVMGVLPFMLFPICWGLLYKISFRRLGSVCSRMLLADGIIIFLRDDRGVGANVR